MDEEKIIRTALRLCSREFGRKTGEKGREKLRFLSAVTEEGVFFQSETLRILCDKIYVLEDECSAVSRLFMSTVRKSALEHGLDIITCRCPLFPNEKTEHIIIPSLRLGFISENRRHKTGVSPFRVIHSRRFVDEKALLKNKAKIRRTLRLAEKLIAEASLCMGEAGAVHKKLEAIYTPAMDFSLVEKKLSEIISEMDS